MSPFFYGLIIILAISLPLSIKILREDERLVVSRLGRFLRIVGPGLVMILPFVDRGIRVNLRENFHGWQGLSKKVRLFSNGSSIRKVALQR